MNAVERLLAREEIRDLAHRYAAALDARDLDTLVGLFCSDVQVGKGARGLHHSGRGHLPNGAR